MSPLSGLARPLIDLAAGRPAQVDAALLPLVHEHRLTGLLATRLEQGELELPAAVAQQVAAVDLANQAHHLRLWRAVEGVAESLRSIEVDPVFLKGVTAERRWYDRLGERPCSDVDVLVPHDQLDRLGEVLDVLAPGYAHRELVLELVQRRQLQHVNLEWEKVWLDVHFDLLKLGTWMRNPEAVDTADGSVCTVSREGGPAVRIPSPELALVNFCTHLNKDRFAYLGGLADVARVVQRTPIDWDRFARVVDDEGLTVPVWKSLVVVGEVLGLDLPAAPPTGWRGRVWDRLWPEEVRLGGRTGRTTRRHRQHALPLLATGRTGEGLAELRRQLVPPKGLLELEAGESDHGYLRRVTVDRLGRARLSRG